MCFHLYCEWKSRSRMAQRKKHSTDRHLLSSRCCTKDKRSITIIIQHNFHPQLPSPTPMQIFSTFPNSTSTMVHLKKNHFNHISTSTGTKSYYHTYFGSSLRRSSTGIAPIMAMQPNTASKLTLLKKRIFLSGVVPHQQNIPKRNTMKHLPQVETSRQQV